MQNRSEIGLNELGQFSVRSNEVHISDPCYEKGSWCAGILEDVLPGKWNAAVLRRNEDWWGVRNAELTACHTDHFLNKMSFKERSNFVVGVDSGQAGIFCSTEFRGGEDDWGDQGWYDKCCSLTLDSSYSAGLLPGGVVSSTGFGDGGYEAFLERNNEGRVIGIKIVFIPEEDFE